MQIKYFIIFILSLILLSSLTACGKKEKKNADLHKFISELKTKISSTTKPAAAMKVEKPDVYTFANQHHPFIEKNRFVTPNTGKDASNKSEYPLQNYKTASLRLIGALHSKNKKWALVETPDDAVYQITLGMPVGSEGGVVSEISPSQIVIKNGTKKFTLYLKHNK